MTKQLVFIDESGDAGFKSGSSPDFAFALIVFSDPQDAEATDKIMCEIASFSKHKPEFKYSKTCNNVKDVFFNMISKCPFRAKVLYVNKLSINSLELRRDANKFYNYFLKQVITHANLSKASIKIDGKKDTVKRELISYIKSQAKESVSKIKYEDSKNNRLIQLADMIVGLVIHAYSPNATPEQKSWLKKNKTKIRHLAV